MTPLPKPSEFSVVKMNEDNTVSDDLKRQAAMFYNSTQRLVYNVYCKNMQLFETTTGCRECGSHVMTFITLILSYKVHFRLIGS